MLDHILGKPSANIRRSQALGFAFLAALLLRRKEAPWCLRWLARWERRVPAWKALIGWSALLYLLKHMDDLLGLNAPEPLREYYSRSFYRTTWVFTALDAGFWTAMSIRPKPLRDVLSLLFSLYYLVFTNRGIEKVRKVRALITIDHLRVSWNKGVDNPLLRFVRRLHSSRLTIHRIVELPQREPSDRDECSSGGRLSEAADLEPAKCHILYAGDAATFATNRHIVLNYPGGGFVSMGPECHMDYLSAWAERTGAIVISVDYAKAPEYPFPYAIDQCYEVYRSLIQTNGRCIGLDLTEPLRVVLAGDSAGGNITASVMFRILEAPDQLRIPEGIVFIYGCFNIDIRAWMTRDETRMLLGAAAVDSPNPPSEQQPMSHSTGRRSLVAVRDHLHHVSPLAVTNLDDGYQQRKFRLGRKKPVYIDDRVRVVRKTPGDSVDNSDYAEEEPTASIADAKSRGVGYVPLTMTSSFTYFNDQVLSPEMMRAMVIMYIGPNGRPNFRTDYYLSPIVAPDHLLERFPPVYFMCGEKDPMVDDTVIFAARIRNAKQKTRSNVDEPANPSGCELLPGKVHEYRDYRSSKLYSRRHSQPPSSGGAHGSTQFYIGSTDVSDNDEDQTTTGGMPLPASLRMSQFPATARATTGQAASRPVIKVKLLAGMSHGFMQMYSLLPESKSVANTLGDWLGELLFGDHTITPYSRCASAVAVNEGSAMPLSPDHGNRQQRKKRQAMEKSVVSVQYHVIPPTPPLSASVPISPLSAGLAEVKSIFARGDIDKHGIEIVSAANMVRRRGYGLADPLN
ncbi:hypothetical protein GGI19_002313 [Coemansia pectinata]|uniref:Alpha/beta hydrolase fold-3 domain-containing protein n=1 Tax=Coemansia pectinata TaxID=1052879 RepID=A0A9W8GW18_9FUNG|nr:hypothetical protein GGI19_002313 [Coemansia pectinata]